ncbi:MAG: hypothetical protein ACRDRA_00085 [Pseudonocardiaceae bacterium]
MEERFGVDNHDAELSEQVQPRRLASASEAATALALAAGMDGGVPAGG